MKTTDFTLTKPVTVEIGTAGTLTFRTLIHAVDHLIGLGVTFENGQPRNLQGMSYRIRKNEVYFSVDQIAITWAIRDKYWKDNS
jgi:hypothetical protein